MLKNIIIITLSCLVFFSVFIQANSYRLEAIANPPPKNYFLIGAPPDYHGYQVFEPTGSFIIGFYFYASKTGSPTYYFITSLLDNNTVLDIKYWLPSEISSTPQWHLWETSTGIIVYVGYPYFFAYDAYLYSITDYYVVYTDNTNPYPFGTFYYSGDPQPNDDAIIVIVYEVFGLGGPCYVNADCETNYCSSSKPYEQGMCLEPPYPSPSPTPSPSPSPSPSASPSPSPSPTTSPSPSGYCNSGRDCNYGYNCDVKTHTCYPRRQDYASWGDFYQKLFLNWNTAYIIIVVSIILFSLMVLTLKRASED